MRAKSARTLSNSQRRALDHREISTREAEPQSLRATDGAGAGFLTFSWYGRISIF